MSRMNSIPVRNVDEYIVLQPEAFRSTLEKLRTIIKSAAPKAEEVISYHIPSFKFNVMLVGIGANKKYCSFYVMSPSLVKEMKEELKDVIVSGATIHFPPGKPLPVALIKKIVKARMMENKVRAALKE